MSIGNSVGFIGRLTKDPEIKTVGGSNMVCNFTLARNRVVKDKDHPESDFVECVAWNHNADFLGKYFFKGNRVGVSGELRTEIYEDTNGVKRKLTKILVNSLEFIDSKSNNDTSATNVERNNNSYEEPNKNFVEIETEEDELPF